MNTKILQNILDKRVDRREFLTYVGAAVVAATGVGTILRSLHLQANKQQDLFGYGDGYYGGRKLQ